MAVVPKYFPGAKLKIGAFCGTTKNKTTRVRSRKCYNDQFNQIMPCAASKLRRKIDSTYDTYDTEIHS